MKRLSKGSHPRKYQISTLSLQHVVGQWSRIDGNGEATGCYGGSYAQGRVLDNHRLKRLNATLLHPYQIRLGIGLAVLDVEGRHDEFIFEKTFEVYQ